MNYEIDALDRDILRRLGEDARTPFLEIARETGVSGGTIHQRVDRLKAEGIVKGSKIVLDPARLGYGIQALVGVHLSEAQSYPGLLKTIQKLPSVVEAHYTTGTYALILKVYAKDMDDYYNFLTHKLQRIEGVRATESFLCIHTPIDREVMP
jgi:Lrp/AsnC family transcriptional regulator for asnA, asnC and gidA